VRRGGADFRPHRWRAARRRHPDRQWLKLLGHAAVEGDIFHQRLSMEEATQFEGSSRLLSNT
jgi:hypothetical protein